MWIPTKAAFTAICFPDVIVEQTGGKICAGDDCSQAKFWPVNKLPPFAFRSNKRALGAYIKSRKDYWAIYDLIEHADKRTLPPAIAKIL